MESRRVRDFTSVHAIDERLARLTRTATEFELSYPSDSITNTFKAAEAIADAIGARAGLPRNDRETTYDFVSRLCVARVIPSNIWRNFETIRVGRNKGGGHGVTEVPVQKATKALDCLERIGRWFAANQRKLAPNHSPAPGRDTGPVWTISSFVDHYIAGTWRNGPIPPEVEQFASNNANAIEREFARRRSDLGSFDAISTSSNYPSAAKAEKDDGGVASPAEDQSKSQPCLGASSERRPSRATTNAEQSDPALDEQSDAAGSQCDVSTFTPAGERLLAAVNSSCKTDGAPSAAPSNAEADCEVNGEPEVLASGDRYSGPSAEVPDDDDGIAERNDDLVEPSDAPRETSDARVQRTNALGDLGLQILLNAETFSVKNERPAALLDSPGGIGWGAEVMGQIESGTSVSGVWVTGAWLPWLRVQIGGKTGYLLASAIAGGTERAKLIRSYYDSNSDFKRGYLAFAHFRDKDLLVNSDGIPNKVLYRLREDASSAPVGFRGNLKLAGVFLAILIIFSVILGLVTYFATGSFLVGLISGAILLSIGPLFEFKDEMSEHLFPGNRMFRGFVTVSIYVVLGAYIIYIAYVGFTLDY